MEDKMLVLQSSDGETFKVDINISNMSTTIKDMLEDVSESPQLAIPLPNIKGEILKKVLSYCKYHHENPDKLVEKEGEDQICEWDETFLTNVSKEMQIEIILAANYLDIKSLMNFMCKMFAKSMLGKTPEQLREMLSAFFNYTCTFSSSNYPSIHLQ
jgi:S-phase kinase-associated protein 1